jgi:aminoglycoside phosphotransferase (APT) family kinase protein
MARLHYPLSLSHFFRRVKDRVSRPCVVPKSAADRSPVEIAAGLLRYLADRFGARRLRFEQDPVPVKDGWETYIFHFRLGEDDALPAEFRGPLTLRLFACPQGVPRGRHKFEVQRFLWQRGYPVPAPLCWEERGDSLGGPFLLMEQVPGPPVLRWAIDRPWAVYAVAARMAELQARLHRLPLEDFPHPKGPLLERTLDEIQDLIRRYELRSLTPGLEWLQSHRPAPPERPCIVHLDFHPLNLIHRPRQLPAVLDWDTADVGDPHADFATTILFLRCGPNQGKNWWERLVTEVGRVLLEWGFLFACRLRTGLDRARLRYYLALALQLRLAHCGRFLIAGPQVTGAKPSLVHHLGPDHLACLCEQFRRATGVRLPALWE